MEKKDIAIEPGKIDNQFLQSLADKAYLKAKEGNINFWTIPDDDPEVKYWKEVWLLGYKEGKGI